MADEEKPESEENEEAVEFDEQAPLAEGSHEKKLKSDDDERFPFERMKIYLFVKDDWEWFAVFLLSQMIFWFYAPFIDSCCTYDDYCSEKRCDGLNEDQYGGLSSGPSGSGVFVVSFGLMFAGTVIWVTRFLMYDPVKEHPELEILDFMSFFLPGDE